MKGSVTFVMESAVTSRKKHSRIRTILTVLLAVVLVMSVLPMTALSVNAANEIIAKTTANLNVRTGAGSNYSVMKTIPDKTLVTVIDRSNASWLKVKLADGKTGYCSADYLDIVTDCTTTDYVNLRSGAGTSNSIVRTLNPNTKLDILRFNGNSWARVKTSDGTTGYVCTDYVKFVTSSTYTVKTTTTTTQTTPAKTLALSETSHTLAKYGQFILKATGNTGKVTWSSADTKIAIVDSNGTVKGVGFGTTNIIATDSSTKKTQKCAVKVIKTETSSITLDITAKTIDAGSSFTLKATTTPAGKKVNFRSSNTSIATVTSAGVVKGVSGGTVNITAFDATGLVTRVCKVTVKQKGSISLNTHSVSVEAGSSVRLNVTKTPSNLKVRWSSSNPRIAGATDGVVSGLRAGTSVITVSDETGKIYDKCNVTVKAISSGSVTLSRYSVVTTAGKTVYIKGYNGSTWKSSDESVATVSAGFIRTKKAGRVSISYENYYGQKAICVVGVEEAAPVRFAYSSPNSATLSDKISLVAVTDKQRQGVFFTVKDGGTGTTVMANKKVAEGNTYVWTAYYIPKKAGTFTVNAFAKMDNKWYTCADGKCDIYVSDKTNAKETGLDRLRASDKMIRFVGEKEGFDSYFYYDTLANNIPTIAHGYVIWEGTAFYNGVTATEGYAMLVRSVNEDDYTRDVNNMLINNKVYFNQQQFDALVSFSYNLGSGWTYSSDLKSILLDSYGPMIGRSSSMSAVVTSSDGLYLRDAASTSGKVLRTLNYNETVTLLSTEKYNGVWYHVKTSSGTTGYCSGTYLRIGASSGGTVRDLTYVNHNALINELLSYHHAGGNCYYGLLYRRVDEAEMFLYGDYAPDGRSNKHGFPSPSCLKF